MLAWLVGCAPPPLTQVPIVGGSPETRAILRDAAIAFDDAVGPGRVRVDEIGVESGPWYASGFSSCYRGLPDGTRLGGVRETVWISESAPSLSRALRHELCHSLFHDEPPDPDDPTLAALADDLFDPGTDYVFPGHDEVRTPALRVDEALSLVCEYSPFFASDVLDGGCPRAPPALEPDAALTDAVAAWMMDHVWTAFTPPDPVRLDPDGGVAVDPSIPSSSVREIRPTTDPSVVVVVLADGDEVPVGLYDGKPTDAVFTGVITPVEMPGGGPGVSYRTGQAAGWADGPVVLAGSAIPIPFADRWGSRLYAHDGRQWTSVEDGCPEGAWYPFRVEGELWLARTDGTLAWTPLLSHGG